MRVTIQYRRNQPGAEGEARRLAALLQDEVTSVEIHPTSIAVRSRVINFYNPADKEAAAALAHTLGNEGNGWIVRPGGSRSPTGSLDVWLP